MRMRSLFTLAAGLSLASCSQIASTLNEPITSDYNPLDGPSVGINRNKSIQQTGPNYRPGQWVETAMPNGTFFDRIPRGSAAADQVLAQGTPLKVVSTKGSYVKVELEGGSVGYVPAIMVAEPSTANDTSPLMPPPPSSPLERSTPSIAPTPSATPGAAGSSAIPAPSNVGDDFDAPSLEPAPERSASEILIPTTQPESSLDLDPVAPADEGVNTLPPPSNVGGFE